MRYNAFRLHGKPGADGKQAEINPYDEKQFTRPIHLYRRYAGDKLENNEASDVASGVDDKERELQATRRAERQAEKEANQALIAPTGEAAKNPAKRKKVQKKVEDVYFDENNKRHVARAQLRYEEARPWHLEDFDNKMKFVGSYEQPLAKSNVMFVIGEQGFKMIPVEKWYKMAPVSKVERTMTSEQIEQNMSQKYAAPRWFMGTQTAGTEARRQVKLEQQNLNRKRKAEDDGDDYGRTTVKREEYQADVDEIDFEFNDEFQDDDEGFVFGDPGDDDAKEIEKRIFDEMRQANLPATGVKNEDKDWDEEEKQEKMAAIEEKRKQKKQRKLLKKKERRIEYESDDSDDNKYESSSDSEDSEEERERLEEERKEEAKKAALLNGDKSGASSKGTNTPNGRSEKKAIPSLKRDAELSELSGNESSRKKAKGSNGRAMSPNGPTGARALSRKSSPKPMINSQHAYPPSADSARRGGYGSGSETDTSRAGGRPKTLKLKNSPPGSPKDRSRTGTPSATGGTATPQIPFPTLDEVRAAIPADGIPIKDLVTVFRARIVGTEQTKQFISLVKEAGTQDAATKRIMPKVA